MLNAAQCFPLANAAPMGVLVGRIPSLAEHVEHAPEPTDSGPTASVHTVPRILAVIVLYKTAPGDSGSYRSLLEATGEARPGALDVSVLLYDNSPGEKTPDHLPANVRYFADPGNSGLAAAYNYALGLALGERYDWLLTLDQDTELPRNFLERLASTVGSLESRPDVAVAVPQILANGRIVSPNYFAGGAWPRFFPRGFTGVPRRPVYAFNSGALFRTAALRQAGGYSPQFWLDNSDSYIFRRLNQCGKRVYVDGSLELRHDFSMMNMKERISPERYRALLLSESAFWDSEMNGLAGLERTLRLLGRIGKHWVRRDAQELQRLTRRALWRRLFRSRKQRLREWRFALSQRRVAGQQAALLPARPVISVCMAAYNGERYIEPQLASILPQLGAGDEVVVVDDCSTDGTVSKVRQVQADWGSREAGPRIILIQHRTNCGLVSTFEDAVRSASGDVLFFSDDDDLWAPEKVKRVAAVFEQQPDVQMVSTGLTLIDEFGQPWTEPDFLRHRSFDTGFFANLLHNRFQGSTMAIRSSLLREVLPFPAGRLFFHDLWIGLRSIVAGCKITYIDEPLLLYRRHRGNHSRTLGRLDQVRRRWQVLVDLLLRSLRRY